MGKLTNYHKTYGKMNKQTNEHMKKHMIGQMNKQMGTPSKGTNKQHE